MTERMTAEEALIKSVSRWGQVQLSETGVQMFKDDLKRLGFILMPVEPDDAAIDVMIPLPDSRDIEGCRQSARREYAALVSHLRKD